jgi:hypothetical protein
MVIMIFKSSHGFLGNHDVQVGQHEGRHSMMSKPVRMSKVMEMSQVAMMSKVVIKMSKFIILYNVSMIFKKCTFVD